jgi:glucose-1-phosphate adenylyltransferase
MKQDIVGMIYTGERVDELQDLTRYRAAAALPMVGRYRLIDFTLANMIHSGKTSASSCKRTTTA